MKLIDITLHKLEVIFKTSKDPVLLCSFGKDSIVMLHLARQINKEVPVILWKENSQFKKYEFAQGIINDWNLTVYDYPPVRNDIVYRNGKIDGIGLYLVGSNLVYKAIEIAKPNGHFACALEDVLSKPTCNGYDFKWDSVLIGHKRTDIDALMGKVELKADRVEAKDVILHYPLFYWTDKDIWEYIHKNNVPYNNKRYMHNGEEYEDKTYNGNYHSACVKCLDPNEEENVYCEREKKEVQNAGQIIDYDKRLKGYTEPLKEYLNMEV